MIKITDVLGAFVEAQLRAAEWEQEFQAQFFGPVRLAEQVQAFLSKPPEERAAMAPDEQAALAEHARRMQQQMSGGQKVTDMGGALPPGAGG
jgi:hypothetical protein